MNAKLKKEINRKEAYDILTLLNEVGYWDPVVTAFMTDNQCLNRLSQMISNYLTKISSSFLYWNKNTFIDGITNNKEIVPMMQHYEYNKYKESLEV